MYIRDLFSSNTVKFLLYIDNISLSYSSTSLKKNTKIHETETKRLYKLALESAIEFDLVKTELIHWNRGKQAQIQVLKLLNNDIVQPKKLVKWLGVYFDQGLTYKEYVTIKVTCTRQAFFRIERLTNTIRGLSPFLFR